MILSSEKKISKKQGAYLLSWLAVLTGGMVYVLWRADTIRFFGWLDAAGLYTPVGVLRAYSIALYPSIPGWIVYSLPNGLWAFGYALIIASLWRDNDSFIKYMWLASIPVVGIGWELLQYTGTLPGVFCLYDLSLSSAGVALGMVIGLKDRVRNTRIRR